MLGANDVCLCSCACLSCSAAPHRCLTVTVATRLLQELEKFKFVLNYKIQELKRMISPRKREIQDLREQMKEMEMELLQYHRANVALDLTISELRLKRNGLSQELMKLRGAIAKCDAVQQRISRDTEAVVCLIPRSGLKATVTDMKKLVSAIVRLYRCYVHGDVATAALPRARTVMSTRGSTVTVASHRIAGVDTEDIQVEVARQRRHLERAIANLVERVSVAEGIAVADEAKLVSDHAQLHAQLQHVKASMQMMQDELSVTAAAAMARFASAKGPSIGHRMLGLRGAARTS